MSNLMFFLNVIGTAAFSISGALTAIRKELDFLGVIILGTITAVGGGIMRDILVGKLPPDAFVDPIYAAIGCLTAMGVFFYVYFHLRGYRKIWGIGFQKIVLYADTIGLAVFSVLGVQVGFDVGEGSNCFLTVFLGTITGVGGGLLRDILAGDKPYILCKHVYACASMAGALTCTLLWNIIGKETSIIISVVIVILIRLLAIHYKWNLPRIKNEY
ncbi:trimeric intracellular cation channel family protein [Butyrivibrio sp. NC3005]|uniref:trimeric intracellular cation channel family protein n=1 Tax=Butyrivibrio sp. NC3005 TaxID=1280685 RepID=UPI00055F56B1|nr:trimeric intracellular cation channel family protein [Butyrivibrio sp. NC3005]